jgi:hypothetical protein
MVGARPQAQSVRAVGWGWGWVVFIGGRVAGVTAVEAVRDRFLGYRLAAVGDAQGEGGATCEVESVSS